MGDPITTLARTNPNPTTVGELMHWLQVQINSGNISSNTPIRGCEVALRVKEEAGVISSNYWLHVAAEHRTLDGEDLGDIHKQVETALQKAYKRKLIPNTEFSLTYDGDDGSAGWTAMAGNPNPKDGVLGQNEPKFMTGEYSTAEEAVQELIYKLA